MNFTPEMMSQMRQHLDMLRQRMRPMAQMGSMAGAPDWMANMRARMAQHRGAPGGGFGGMGGQGWQRATPAAAGTGIPFIDRTNGWQAGFPGAPAPYQGTNVNIPFIDRTGGR